MSKTLSERLEAHADSWPSVYGSDRENITLLREAAALARRVEDAAIARIENGGEYAAINPSDGDSFIAVSKMIGQRVRLVPEVAPPNTEGGEDV